MSPSAIAPVGSGSDAAVTTDLFKKIGAEKYASAAIPTAALTEMRSIDFFDCRGTARFLNSIQLHRAE